MNFINYLKSDLYKLVHSKILLAHILVPILGIVLFLSYYSISSLDNLDKVSAYIQVVSMAFPFIISMVINMMYEQEESAGGFQYFLSVPNNKYIPHLSKITLLILLGLASTLISILGFGFIFNLVENTVFDLSFYFKESLIIFTSNFLIYMLHYLVVFNLGKGASIGLGVIGSLISALMLTGLGDGIWVAIPWAYSIRFSTYFFSHSINNNLLFTNEFKTAIFLAILFILVSIAYQFIFANCWEGKREYY